MPKQDRGAATRERLLAATRQVVREVGYAHATTRVIAAAAGVAEGTIYRHFPNKVALFFTAALEQDSEILGQLADLPNKAGHASVHENLTWGFTLLASLREKVLPLELALLTDPELASMWDAMPVPALLTPDPPQAVAEYLRAEQRIGRVRVDLDPRQVTEILLASLFGIAVLPSAAAGEVDETKISRAVDLFVDGLSP